MKELKALEILKQIQLLSSKEYNHYIKKQPIEEATTELEARIAEFEAERIEHQEQLVEHSQIAHRALLIGEENGWFEWKGGIDGGSYSSLYKDIIKIRDYVDIHDFVNFNNKVIDAYKSKITELEALQEPKSCDGCKYSLADGTSDRYSNTCKLCTRHGTDYYEPKEQP